MSQSVERHATYEDVCRIPGHLIAQIVGGQLITLPRPAPKQARASSSLGDELLSPFDKGRGGPCGWWIFDEPEPHLGPDILVPDLAGWRRERMPLLPGTAYFELFPDWVCEVLSPATARIDRVDKLPIYAAHGVGHVWLMDPDARTLAVLALHEGRWVWLNGFKDADEVRAVPFDAIAFSLAVLWP